jgi:uncharacterized membrane protein YoaK (UPF0700 family)
MSEQFTKYLTWSFDEFRRRGATCSTILRRSRGQKNLQVSLLLLTTWTAYVIGAICGAAGHSFADLKSLLIPMLALTGLAILDVYQPLAIQDEEQQHDLSS